MGNNNFDKLGYVPAQAAHFSGEAFLKVLVTPDQITNCSVADVWFEAGCRNNWHMHPSNQILLIKQGCCYYQEDGQPVHQFKAGSTINILPGVKHWHGASPDAYMVHTAININTERGTVNWLEPVTDQQYHNGH